MKPALLPAGLRGERRFRWRGGEVSRLEALSDAVFALSLTLLVVALEVPRTSGELIHLFWQFPAFGICFAFILWVWYEHYLYHRRYGFEDASTVALNGLLLFFVVFYVYPLKFLAAALITEPVSGLDMVAFGERGMAVMLLYSGGFVGIFSVMSLMYGRAWRLRDQLELNAAEREATLGSLRSQLLSVSIGVVSLIAVLTLPQRPALSGLVYFLMGPLHGLNGWWTGKRVAEKGDR